MIEPLSCEECESIVEVAKKLREHVIRYIYVVNEKGSPVGVISTTDMNNRVVAEGKNPSETLAKDIMTTPIHAVDVNSEEKKAYEECLKNNVATCAVTEDGKLIGLVTVHELLRKVSEDKGEN